MKVKINASFRGELIRSLIKAKRYGFVMQIFMRTYVAGFNSCFCFSFKRFTTIVLFRYCRLDDFKKWKSAIKKMRKVTSQFETACMIVICEYWFTIVRNRIVFKIICKKRNFWRFDAIWFYIFIYMTQIDLQFRGKDGKSFAITLSHYFCCENLNRLAHQLKIRFIIARRRDLKKKKNKTIGRRSSATKIDILKLYNILRYIHISFFFVASLAIFVNLICRWQMYSFIPRSSVSCGMAPDNLCGFLL